MGGLQHSPASRRRPVAAAGRSLPHSRVLLGWRPPPRRPVPRGAPPHVVWHVGCTATTHRPVRRPLPAAGAAAGAATGGHPAQVRPPPGAARRAATRCVCRYLLRDAQRGGQSVTLVGAGAAPASATPAGTAGACTRVPHGQCPRYARGPPYLLPAARAAVRAVPARPCPPATSTRTSGHHLPPRGREVAGRLVRVRRAGGPERWLVGQGWGSPPHVATPLGLGATPTRP